MPFGSSSSSALFNQSHNIPNPNPFGSSSANPPPLHHQYNSHVGFGGYNNISLSSIIMGPPTYDSTAGLVAGSNAELPSNQTPPSILGDEAPMGASGNTNEDDHYEIAPVPSQGNSGLLDDVLAEAHNISNKRLKSEDSSSGVSGKEKGVVVEEESAEEEEDDTVQVESTLKNSGDNSAENQRDDSSSPSSIGMKLSEDPLDEMDDDLLSLLNFSSTVPAVSETSWYLAECMSTSENASENVGLDTQQNAPLTSTSVKTTAAAPEVQRTLGACYWNNMPGIC